VTNAWRREAASVAAAMERQAAQRYGLAVARWPAYSTTQGALHVEMQRNGLRWRLAGKNISRAKALGLIAERMESRLS